MDEGYQWAAEMPLLTSRFFLYDLAKILFWTGLICGAIFIAIALFSGGPEAVPKLLVIFALILAGFGFLFALIALVFFRNGYPMRFFVGPAGVGWESASGRGAAASRAAMVVGALAGSPGTAGAGLLAQAQESGLLGWDEVARVKVYPALRVLSVMNGWRVVIRLYATPENFHYVLDLVRRYAPRTVAMMPGPRGGEGRAPVAAFELLRRAALVGGITASLWLAFDAPALLIHVRRADFAAEYQRKYGEREGPAPGAMGAAREFLRQHAKPASLEDYIARTTEKRVLGVEGAEWSRLYSTLGAGGRWYRPEDPPVVAVLPGIRRVYSQAGWLVMYLPVDGGHLEFEYVNRPKESKAPPALVYPNREFCWIWALAGVAVYCLLPWPRPSPRLLLHDGAVSVGLDVIGGAAAAFFLALPVYVASSTAEALEDELGMTLFLWAIGGIGLAILLWSASRAAFHVALDPHQLRVGGLGSAAALQSGEISAVEYILRGEAPTGIEVSTRRGQRKRLSWHGLPYFEGVLQLLRGWGHAPRLRVS